MTALIPPDAPTAPSRTAGPVRVVFGLLLVAPAAVALLVGYAWPSVRTLLVSLHNRPPGQERRLLDPDRFVGLDNYRAVVDAFDGPLPPIAFALSLAIGPLLVLLVVAPLLAWAAHRAGRPARLTVRVALAVPMVCIVPAALAIGWLVDRFDIDTPRASVGAAVGLTTFGLLCGLGVTLYLAVLRRGDAGERRWPAAGTVAGVAVIAVVAVALQAFTYPMLMTGGGPAHQTATPLLDAYQLGLVRAAFGPGAAVAMMLLVPVMVLGVGAALLVILTGLRLEVDPAARSADEPSGWGGGRVAAMILTGLGLAAVLVVTRYGLWPWLSRLAGSGPLDGSTALGMLARTWLPPVISTVVGVGLAVLAGFGIGALRPLGRWSELLLLPFAPWLFVGIGPLFIAKFETAVYGPVDRVDTVAGLVPPVWLVVPALFVFTLLFRGLAGRRLDTTGGGYGRLLPPALPMVALVAGATWLVQSQGLLWGLLVAIRDPTAPVWLMHLTRQFEIYADDLGFGLVLPIPMVVVFAVALAVLQVFYLDRLAIRTGRS